jgi:hypothetical protein
MSYELRNRRPTRAMLHRGGISGRESAAEIQFPLTHELFCVCVRGCLAKADRKAALSSTPTRRAAAFFGRNSRQVINKLSSGSKAGLSGAFRLCGKAPRLRARRA